LLYLKHTFNLGDEELVVRWSENVVWQYFSGLEYYTPKLPRDATRIGRFRTAIGEAGEGGTLEGQHRGGGTNEGDPGERV
jgi:IS5 family transposase